MLCVFPIVCFAASAELPEAAECRCLRSHSRDLAAFLRYNRIPDWSAGHSGIAARPSVNDEIWVTLCVFFVELFCTVTCGSECGAGDICAVSFFILSVIDKHEEYSGVAAELTRTPKVEAIAAKSVPPGRVSFCRSATVVGVLTIFWVSLNETFTLTETITGMVVGIVAIVLTNRLILGGQSYADRFWMSPGTVILYSGYLLYKIYAAGFSALVRLIRGNIQVAIVDINTELSDDCSIALLANSITLTPGTVTLDRQGKRIKIIWLTDSEQDLTARNKLIKGAFERILLRRLG